MIKFITHMCGIFIFEKSSLKFIVGVCLGLAFSISIILSTIGIMDGFELSLKQKLQKASGDLYFYSHSGFFSLSPHMEVMFSDLGIKSYSPMIRTEGFIIADIAKGVIIKGIDSKTFFKVGPDIKLSSDEIVLGSELASILNVKVGQFVTLGLASGNSEFESMPFLKSFKIKDVISHGIYTKDSRFVYVDLKILQSLLKVGHAINIVSLNVKEQHSEFTMDESYINKVEEMQKELLKNLDITYSVRPFWHEFSGLLEAVKVEKVMIGLILQLVVMVSIFNVLAFIIFLNEKKSKEIFLLSALGLSSRRIISLWIGFIFIIWAISASISILFVKLFSYVLSNLSLLQLPGDVYTLGGNLIISLDMMDYLIVFGPSLLWPYLISAPLLFKLKRESTLYRLRKEFA